MRDYATSAPSAEMREFAALASARGFRQETLAKALQVSFRASGLNGANVARHFSARTPQHQTVAAYAKLLGVGEEYRAIVRGDFPRSRDRRWQRLLYEELRANAADFLTGSIEKAIDAYDALQAAEKKQALLAFARSYLRSRHGIGRSVPGWETFPAAEVLSAFAAALAPRFDLRNHVARTPSNQKLLDDIYWTLRSYFDDLKARRLIDVLAAALRLDGTDTDPLWGYLNASLGAFAARKRARNIGEDGK